MEREKITEIVGRMGRYISGRDRCRSEVALHINKKRLCSRDEVDAVLDFLEEQGFIDEERFVTNRVEYRLGQGYGPRYMQQEFRQLRIDDDIIRAALDLEEEELLDAARVALDRKRRQLTTNGVPDDLGERLTRYLQGRGFEYAQIKRLLKGGPELLD